ncbi:outer membrane beta-barrel protein [Leeia sp. TBRC 13508]|uniref:Outer membrane beta-barrel protein n=1 Tax=Leeia speluncae TaxID=2884804 RepID=A0ABS8D4X7_9NEIS|nr:OmpW family outer membrane protein [Leeia speluncae]MCB6183280.1 outer membrane beta-barrel protein [Leeia speluncae]
MNCKLLSAVLVTGLCASLAVKAEDEGNWMIRARAVNLDMAQKSDPVSGTGASNRLTVNNKVIPELDVSYFFTPNIAAELVLTVPQKQNVYLDGDKIGTFKHLPPTLLAQYHFNPEGNFRPYVGAGVNYTLISKEQIANGAYHLDNHSTGLALQVGFDYKLGKNVYLNVDLKKLRLRSDVLDSSNQKVSRVKLDPVLFGIGIGYRF